MNCFIAGGVLAVLERLAGLGVPRTPVVLLLVVGLPSAGVQLIAAVRIGEVVFDRRRSTD